MTEQTLFRLVDVALTLVEIGFTADEVRAEVAKREAEGLTAQEITRLLAKMRKDEEAESDKLRT